MKHLLDSWPAVDVRLRAAEHLLLMLDFDGTLAPIVPHPPDARIPDRTMETLRSLAQCPSVTIAIVSGRSAVDVRSLAGLADVHYFGSHGRERIRPGGNVVEANDQGRSAIAAVCRRLVLDLADVTGFEIENKGLSAAAHYRNSDPRYHERITKSVHREVGSDRALRASPGKMVIDITPADGFDKGVAATALLREIGGLALYFGDDTTDESAFRALPRKAITVFVGPIRSESRARFRVADPPEVGTALARILKVVADLTAPRLSRPVG